MAVTVKTLYGTDFAQWAAQTAELLRERRFDEIDIENVAEEIRSLGDSEWKGARSQMRRMLMHLIKQKIQPEREGSSWRASIVSAQREILDAIDLSPSLRRRLGETLATLYIQALRDAGRETGLATHEVSAKCPFALTELLDSSPAAPDISDRTRFNCSLSGATTSRWSIISRRVTGTTSQRAVCS
jgi:hypothetical protein